MTDPGPAPSTAPPSGSGNPSQPEEDKIPLLDVLHDLGTTLVQSEIPSHSQLGQVVGAIVKVMDHAGVQVADELYPEEPAVVARPETQEAIHRQKTNDRLERVETLLSDLFDHIKNSGSSSSVLEREEQEDK